MELAQILNVDFSHVESKISEVVYQDKNLSLILGQLIHRFVVLWFYLCLPVFIYAGLPSFGLLSEHSVSCIHVLMYFYNLLSLIIINKNSHMNIGPWSF